MVGRSVNSELVMSYQEHARCYAYKLLRSWQVRLCADEVASNAAYALCIAARNFDSSLGTSFSTFLFHHVRGALLNTIRSSKKQSDISEELKICSSLSISDSEYALEPIAACQERQYLWREIRRIYEIAKSSLTALEQLVVNRCVMQDESLASVAKDLGYSRSHICRVRTRALAKLRISYERYV